MSNPVFDRLNKDLDKGYAGFGRGPQAPTAPQYGQPGYGQPGYGQPQYGQYGQPQYGQRGPADAMSPQSMEDLYQQPSAGPLDTGRLTVDDVIMKFAGLFTLGGTAPLDPGSLVAAMVGVHTLIGVGEGVLTALVVGSVVAVRPDLVHGARRIRAASIQAAAPAPSSGHRA